MKRIFLYFVVLVALLAISFLAYIVYSQEATIYDKIIDIRSNPKSYTLVIGKVAAKDEVNLALELVAFLKITQTNSDAETDFNNNLVIVGIKGNNKKIFDNVKETEIKDMLIKAVNNNLVIAASDIGNLKKATDIIKNYEQNKKKLLKQELTSESRGLFFMQTLFSPIKSIPSMVLLYITVTFLIVGTSTTLIVRHKRKAKEKSQKQNQAYFQLRNYVLENLGKGYSEEQITSSLLQSGWKPDIINPIFDEIKSFQRK